MFLWTNKPLQWVEGWNYWHLEFKKDGPLCGSSTKTYPKRQSLRLWKPIYRCDRCLSIIAERLGIK